MELDIISRIYSFFKGSFLRRISFLYFFVHLCLLIALEGITAFAPDEGNYKAIFNKLYNSGFSLNGYVGWTSPGSINFLRLLYLPAKVLNLIGFSEILSLRLLSILTTYISLLLLLKINKGKFQTRKWNERLISFPFFIPTILLWTTLSLRESFILLFLVSIFYYIERALNSQRMIYSLPLFFASAGLFLTKTYLYVLLLIGVIAALFVQLILQKRNSSNSWLVIVSLVVPLALFPSMSKPMFYGAEWTIQTLVFENRPPVFAPEASSPGAPGPEAPGPASTLVPIRGQTLHDLNSQIDQNPFLRWVAGKTGVREFLEAKTKMARVPGDSIEFSENRARLQKEPGLARNPISTAKAAMNFLFIPAPFVDNGSFFLNIQSYESFFWYVLYFLFLLLIIRLLQGRYTLTLSSIAATFFCLGFILLSALSEINDGTAVRHRSVLLFGFLVMVAVFRENDAHTRPAEA